MKTLSLKGVIPPVITPFTTDGGVDYDAYARNLERWNTRRLAGYLALGSNSESVYLSEEEKLRVLEITVQASPRERIVLAGTGLESTRETIRFTNKTARLGVAAALVLTPSYYRGRMTDEALISHFREVADHSEIPILIYNVPKFTGINVSARTVEALSQHPNIVGMKDSSGDIPQLVSFQRVADPDFIIAVGTASAWYPALTLGVQAGILALANCCPDECSEVRDLWECGRAREAEALFRNLSPVNAAVTARFGIAGLKYACGLRGYSGGCVRSPLLPLKPEEEASLVQIFQQACLLPVASTGALPVAQDSE